MNTEDIIICSDDARALAAVLNGPVEHAATLLSEVFGGVEIVDTADMPSDIVRLNAPVEYVEAGSGVRRRVTLVVPADADPALKRVSVLSPVGRALYGRAVGAETQAELPNGQTLVLKIAAVGAVQEPQRATA